MTCCRLERQGNEAAPREASDARYIYTALTVSRHSPSPQISYHLISGARPSGPSLIPIFEILGRRAACSVMDNNDLSSSFIPSAHKPTALLPISRHREHLLYLIETYPVTIVIGETGSGKTTQLPQFLEQAGWCQDGKVVAITQVCKLTQWSLDKILTLMPSLAKEGGRNNSSYQSSRGDEM